MGMFNRMSKREKIKELKGNMEIQINNNKVLRTNLQKEQQYSRNLEIERNVLKEELEKVKENLRIAIKDNETLAKMLNELIVKYNVKFETNEKPKAKRTTKKKEEE